MKAISICRLIVLIRFLYNHTAGGVVRVIPTPIHVYARRATAFHS